MQHTPRRAYMHTCIQVREGGLAQPPSWADVVQRCTHSGWRRDAGLRHRIRGSCVCVCVYVSADGFPAALPQGEVQLGRSQDDSVYITACGRDGNAAR